MANYTHLNLAEVENAARRFGMPDELDAHFATRPLGLEKSAVSYQRLAPGFRQPFGHSHKEQEELYVVLAGGGRVKVEDDVVELRALDALRVPSGVTRQFEAGPDGIELLAIGAPNQGDQASADVEMKPEWWSD